MDMPYNYYVPNGKNSRLLDRTDRVEFNRETLDGNTGFQLKILYLEHAFGTKYFIMDRVTGSMMGIYDDKVEQINLKGQLKPFNINQLNRVMHILGQRRLGFDTSSIPTDDIPEESQMGQSSNRMEYPSTPKQFNLFQEYKNVEHDGNMLTADQRTKVYEDRSKVIAEMAEPFYIFSRSIFFNPEMADQYNLSHDKYINYFSQIVWNIDIFLQEDQLMCTKAGFSLVPVPGYLPNSNDLEQRNADQITQTACDKVNSITREMQVIMQGDNKHPHINKSGSFSCLRSFELNDMVFSLNKISPITFNVENPQTPADCGIKSRALTSTPRERWAPQVHNEAANLNKAHHEPSGNASYNPDESITNKHVQGRFVPPKADNLATQPQQQSSSKEGSKENTILNGPTHDRERSAQGRPSGSTDNMPQGPVPTAPTMQAGGPPQAPPVTNPSRNHQDPLECSDTNGSTRAPANGKGPGASKPKKASEPHPRTAASTCPASQPSDSLKNTIICSGCGKSGHWSRNCPYYNFCDFCRVTTHSTHMCRANKHRPRSPVCIYCGKTNHSSAYCRYRPRDNWEEPRHTPDALKTGATGKNLAPGARNQAGSTHCNINNNPFSHIDGRGQNQHNGGSHRPQHREQAGAAPRGEQMDNNPNFPPRRQQHTHFNEGHNRRYSPAMFPSLAFNNTMASDAVGRSIILLAENQSHSLDFILVGQQSQMDAYREMTHSNQARKDDALFAGIEVYDGEDPSRFEGWLDAMEQACNITDLNLQKN